MREFNLTGTINVVTEAIESPKKYCVPQKTAHGFMKVEELLEIEKSGIEIACHGRSHKNTVEDILDNMRFTETTDGTGMQKDFISCVNI